jgi:hypothetical protein
MYSLVSVSLLSLVTTFGTTILSIFLSILAIGLPVFLGVKLSGRVMDWFFTLVLQHHGYDVPATTDLRRGVLDDVRNRQVRKGMGIQF